MAPRSFFVAYASSAAVPFSSTALMDLLTTSRTNNHRVGLSGLLLYRGGNFLQALEGPDEAVQETMGRISRDRRHRSIVQLYDGYHDERLFADWSMGFQDLTGADADVVPGLSDYLSRAESPGASGSHSDHEIFEFFRAFRDHMR